VKDGIGSAERSHIARFDGLVDYVKDWCFTKIVMRGSSAFITLDNNGVIKQKGFGCYCVICVFNFHGLIRLE
jgi:hypothetical protein